MWSLADKASQRKEKIFSASPRLMHNFAACRVTVVHSRELLVEAQQDESLVPCEAD